MWSFFPCKHKYLHLCPGFAFMRKTSVWRCICKGNLAQNCFCSRNYLHLHEHLGYVFWIFVFEEFWTWQNAGNECNMHRISDAVFTQLSSCLENALLISCLFFFFLIAITDVYSLVQFPSQESRHTDWEHWGGLQKWPQTDAPLGSYLRLAKIKISVYLQHTNWNTPKGTKIVNDSKQWTQTLSRLKSERWNTL